MRDQRPPVSDVTSKKFTPFIRFLRGRLAPETWLGLHLTIGALVLLGAGWLFGGIAEDVMHADPITLTDMRVAHWFDGHATPLITACMLLVTHLHDPAAVLAYAALIALYLFKKKERYWLIVLAASVPGGMLLNVGLKYAFHRTRPSFAHPLVNLSTYSFPSGHTVGVTVFYGVLAAYWIAHVRPWRRALQIAAGAVVLVALVGFSRIYLGAHYLSDVLAGMAEGVAWLALCLTAATSWRKHRAQRRLPG